MVLSGRVSFSFAFIGWIGVPLMAFFVEVLLEDVDNDVLQVRVISSFDGQNSGFRIGAHWLILIQNDSLVLGGVLNALPHGDRLFLLNLGSQIWWEKVDKKGHTDLVDDVVVGGFQHGVDLGVAVDPAVGRYCLLIGLR